MKTSIATWTKSDAEINEFIKDNQLFVYKACKHAGMPRCDWDACLFDLATRFASGKLEYDPVRGTKYSTYIYKIARNYAIDELRRLHPERYHDMEDRDWENICDERNNNSQMHVMDKKSILAEAIRRLIDEVHDKRNVEILVRSLMNGETRSELAMEYGKKMGNLSLIKTRYLSRLKKIIREVMEEEEDGTLELSNTDISFLKPYMKW